MLARDAGSGYIIPTCIRSVKVRGGVGGGGGGAVHCWRSGTPAARATSSPPASPTSRRVGARGEAACICNVLVITHNGRGRGGRDWTHQDSSSPGIHHDVQSMVCLLTVSSCIGLSSSLLRPLPLSCLFSTCSVPTRCTPSTTSPVQQVDRETQLGVDGGGGWGEVGSLGGSSAVLPSAQVCTGRCRQRPPPPAP